MSRQLIYVDALNESIRGISKNIRTPGAVELMCLFQIAEQPIVDAVEVVRCFDCEYGFDWDRDEPYDEVYCAGYCNLREADEVIVQVYSCDYCSYGKRRTDT